MASDLEPLNRLKTCRHGPMLFNPRDSYVGRSFDLYGEFSEGEINLFRQIVSPGDVVVEVGANIGSHTVFLGQQAGAQGIVIAFEPQRIAFQLLCANVALNGLLNVFAFAEAVGAAPGTINVPALDYRSENNFGGLALGPSEHGERVPLVTIDRLGLQRCDLIKVDVEGMEQDVLEGARQTIERLKPVLYVENDRQDKSDALLRLLDALGYRMYWYLTPLFSPQNFFGNNENVFGPLMSHNMLCVHRDKESTLEGFRPVDVPGNSGPA